MTYYKILLLFIFIGVVICEPTNTESSRITNKPTKHWKSATTVHNVTTTKDKVEIKVYYESLCPFSVSFFVSQLKPSVKRLGSHLDIRLIPYGHAKTYENSGRYWFSCQHGNEECYRNAVQACAIDVLRNNSRAVYFNTCLMQYSSQYYNDHQYFTSIFYLCGYLEKVNTEAIRQCVNTQRGAILLKRYGDKTHALGPAYVPYVVIDGSTQYDDEATSNLFATVCRLLRPKPRVCYNQI